MFGSTDKADSAGQPWEGRSFDENPFAFDDGSTPVAYAEAIAVLRALPLEASVERVRAQQAVVDAIRESRFLIPLLAEAGDVGFTDEGLKVDKTQELAIVAVEGPSGQRVLPVFSNVATMVAWNREARPVPAEGRRVALAAASDGAQWIVVDPTTETEFVVRRPAVEAIAKGEPWIPSPIDPVIDAFIVNSITGDYRLQNVALLAGDPDAHGLYDELVVQLTVAPGLSEREIQLAIEGLTDRWGKRPEIGAKIDSLRIQLIAGTQ